VGTQCEGRIVDSEDAGLRPWEPAETLRTVSQGEARLSRGFLRAEPEVWFASIGERWLPIFHSLGVQVEMHGVEMELSLANNVERSSCLEIDGEPAVIGWDFESRQLAADSVVSACTGIPAEVITEYLERRLLATLARSWCGNSPLSCHYVPSKPAKEVNVVGVAAVCFSLSGRRCKVYFGLGPRVVERFDLLWREYVYETVRAKESEDLVDQTSIVSVELTELAVPPAMLIDYMKSGTVINLDFPISSNVLLRVDGEPWISGELVQLNGRFAVVITDIEGKGTEIPEATTRVSVELARGEMASEDLFEYAQEGAIWVTNSKVSSHSSLVISGETVASGMVGKIDEHIALSVLPK